MLQNVREVARLERKSAKLKKKSKLERNEMAVAAK